MNTESKEILITKRWLTDIVIGFGLCPFASKVYEDGKISFSSTAFSQEAILNEMNLGINQILDETDLTTTKLIVIREGLEDLDDYLDIHYALEEELKRTELDKIFQLASFHPHYVFKDKDPSAVSNYTNRSPYPIIHILRVADVSEAIENHPDIHSVAPSNIKMMEDKGLAVIQKLWYDKGFTTAT